MSKSKTCFICIIVLKVIFNNNVNNVPFPDAIFNLAIVFLKLKSYTSTVTLATGFDMARLFLYAKTILNGILTAYFIQ